MGGLIVKNSQSCEQEVLPTCSTRQSWLKGADGTKPNAFLDFCKRNTTID